MKILILGDQGFLGKNLTKVLLPEKNELIGLSRRNGLNLTDFDNTAKIFKEVQPDVVVNCAALVGSLNYVTEIAATIFDINCRKMY